MVLHLIFLTNRISNQVGMELARREICWLIKDRLIPSTAAGRAQAGFSFVRAQVEPTSREGLVDILFERFGKQVPTDYIRKVLNGFLRNFEETAFIVPLRKEIDLSPLVRRLAFSKSIVKISGAPVEGNIAKLVCTRKFWLTSWSKNLIARGNHSSADMAIFNIIHPYQEGCTVNVENGSLTDIASGKVLKPDDFAEYKSKIASTVVPINIDEGLSLKLSNEKLNHLVKKVASWSLSGNVMKDVIGSTGALSAANTLFILRHRGKDREESNKKVLESLIRKLIRFGDSYGMSLHLFMKNRKESKIYLGLKKHPRDSKLDELGPPFNPMHEMRKLEQVEQVRNTHPGYKGPYGNREKIQKLTSGWALLIARPGFKNCEDFHVMLESPQEVKIDPYAGNRPNFQTIFEEVRRHLVCPHSGAQWLEAVFHLWFADKNPEGVIRDSLKQFPECECMQNLRYDNEAFLWLIYYLFVEEDMNYRFWYHPPIRGLRYRKQGRDMPMNGILRVAVDPFDKSLPKKTEEQTRRTGGLVKRPSFLEFRGPEYLRETFSKIITSSRASTP